MGEHKVIISFASAGGTGSLMPFSSNWASDPQVKEHCGSLESRYKGCWKDDKRKTIVRNFFYLWEKCQVISVSCKHPCHFCLLSGAFAPFPRAVLLILMTPIFRKSEDKNSF